MPAFKRYLQRLRDKSSSEWKIKDLIGRGGQRLRAFIPTAGWSVNFEDPIDGLFATLLKETDVDEEKIRTESATKALLARKRALRWNLEDQQPIKKRKLNDASALGLGPEPPSSILRNSTPTPSDNPSYKPALDHSDSHHGGAGQLEIEVLRSELAKIASNQATLLERHSRAGFADAADPQHMSLRGQKDMVQRRMDITNNDPKLWSARVGDRGEINISPSAAIVVKEDGVFQEIAHGAIKATAITDEAKALGGLANHVRKLRSKGSRDKSKSKDVYDPLID